MTPYNTGKVRIGIAYQRQPQRPTGDMERLQSVLLPSNVKPHSLTVTEALGEMLIAAALIALPLLLMAAPLIWDRLFE